LQIIGNRSSVGGVATVRGAGVAAAAVAVVAAATLGAACTPDAVGSAPGDGGKVVTTVAPITDIVRQVAGPDVEVVGIVPDGTDSHTFEPGPSVARELADARLFIANGLFLEEPSLQLAEANLPAGRVIVTLADRVVDEDEWVFDASFPRERGVPNPHLWTSPPLAIEYARIVADQLARVDPDGADGYRDRFDAYATRLDALDRAIAEAVATIPEQHRKLVTYHDSFPYFAPRYGFEIVGAIQPADLSEPSAREVADLIDQIRAEGVPAIFGSEVFPSDVLAQIAAETGSTYVEDLRDDELPGAPGDPEHSYVGMMVFNVRTIVEALGGEATALDAVDPGR
jgi:ABC-type Zn uptake system ZnuABC Zn-binding protein ZnuA